MYKGGIISYTNQIKMRLLGVEAEDLERYGPVSEPVARQMAEGARKALVSDIAVSVTGLAGPGGDEFGNPVGTVFIGYSDAQVTLAREYHFEGNREDVRNAAVREALKLILEHNP